MQEKTPKYVQIYNQLKQDLYVQKYPVGSLLPTEDQLVELFSTSKTTLRHAIAMLMADGLISVRQGRGTEVLPVERKPISFEKFKNAVITSTGFIGEDADKTMTTSNFFIERAPGPERVIASLRLSGSEPMFRVQYFQMRGKTTVNFVTTFVPCAIAPDLDEHAGEIIRLYPYLIENYHVNIIRTEDTATFSASNLAESRLLAVECGTPVMNISRVAFSTSGPLLCSNSIFRADILRMSLVMDSPDYTI